MCRPSFRDAMLAFLQGKEEGLCPDCRRRTHTNPLRVLDCKMDGCREIITDAPQLMNFLCSHCHDHFSKVRWALEQFDLTYRINPKMVRGLDYYTKTAFEVTTDSLGAQNAVAGGGRYDGLVAELGGPEITGIGFAVGMERLLSLLPLRDEDFHISPDLFIAALGEKAKDHAFVLSNRLRLKGLWVEMDYLGKSLKSQMKRADRMGSRYVLILGERELAEKKAELRDMIKSTQETVNLDDCEATLLTMVKKR